jgi:hypothetical protein
MVALRIEKESWSKRDTQIAFTTSVFMAKDQLFMLGGRNLLLTCSHGTLPLAVNICPLLLIGQWDFRAKKEGRAHMCVWLAAVGIGLACSKQ